MGICRPKNVLLFFVGDTTHNSTGYRYGVPFGEGINPSFRAKRTYDSCGMTASVLD